MLLEVVAPIPLWECELPEGRDPVSTTTVVPGWPMPGRFQMSISSPELHSELSVPHT